MAGRTRYRGEMVGALVSLVAALLLGGCIPVPGPGPAPEGTTPATVAAAQTVAAQRVAAQTGPLALPDAFRYEVRIQPAGQPGEAATAVTGQYRNGEWSQSATHGGDSVEELVVARTADGALNSYTRAGRTGTWTRWPGAGFDAGYGLASPFAVLRLYPLANQVAADGVEEGFPAPEPVAKVQTTFTPETIGQLLQLSANAATADPDERASLTSQVSALLAPQTITYWATEGGRIYQAAATLLAVGEAGEPAPWLEVTWRFSDYDDAGITVAAPADFSDVAELAAAPGAAAPGDLGGPVTGAETGAREPELDPATTLRIRVFENQGVLAQNATVTAYPAGKRQAVDEKASADAQFALKPGEYDVLVRAANAEQRLEGIVVMEDGLASRDVLFSFGTLVVTVLDNGTTPQVDIIAYPAGQHEIWADYRSENPATLRVPAGVYDLEVALPDFSGTKTVTGIEVRGGETITQTIDVTK